MQKNNNKLILDKIKHTFESIREELNKSKGHAPKPKGEVSAKKKDKGRVIHDSVLRDVELTEEKKKKKKKKKAVKASASVPGVRRTPKGQTTFYGRQLGAKKVIPKKKRHIVAQNVRTVKTPTKRVGGTTITVKSDDFTVKDED
jgi:predicted phage gp36 major capsid-like protein